MHMHTYMHTYYIHACIHTYIRIQYTHTHTHIHTSSIDMYNNDGGKKFMKQTGAIKAATLYFAS
jgi:hypothetical protein